MPTQLEVKGAGQLVTYIHVVLRKGRQQSNTKILEVIVRTAVVVVGVVAAVVVTVAGVVVGVVGIVGVVTVVITIAAVASCASKKELKANTWHRWGK